MQVKHVDVATELEERELIERCARGDDLDHSAFRELYRRRVGETLRFLRRMLDEVEAEDVAQETFLRLHRALRAGRVDSSRPLRPYLLRIARNAAIEVLRRRERELKLEPQPHTRADPVGEAARLEQATVVRKALAALPPEHRAVVILRHLHGLKQRAIAEALDCSERTARNRLRAAAVLLERELRRRGVVSEEVDQ